MATIDIINTYINKIAADETADIIVHFFAAFAASIASAWLPCAQNVSTCDALRIATIPKGIQHNTVDRIAQTK